jgi:hypothetical protein
VLFSDIQVLSDHKSDTNCPGLAKLVSNPQFIQRLMKFSIPTATPALGAYVPRFLALGGEKLWAKRWRHLGEDFKRSPMLQKICSDYHWLELLLHDQSRSISAHGQLAPPLIVEDIAVLHFIAMLLEVHARLTPAGKARLEGRVRAALSAETGFAALYLEMDIAHRLFNAGCDVEFPDLEGTAQCDLLFSNARVSGEVECKSLSADAGRKIHRKDFYRLLQPLEQYLLRRAQAGAREVLLVTLKDRLPSKTASQQRLRDAIERAASGAKSPIDGDFFSIQRQDFGPTLEAALSADRSAFYKACNDRFGENVHVAGPMSDQGCSVVVMRSLLGDDTSRPWLDAMEKAASQFSGTRPGFIAVQVNDVATHELMHPHLRRRAEVLANAIFRRSCGQNVAAVFISPYRGLMEGEAGLVAPAFGFFNLESRFEIDPADFSPFYGTMPDHEFARRIQARG